MQHQFIWAQDYYFKQFLEHKGPKVALGEYYLPMPDARRLGRVLEAIINNFLASITDFHSDNCTERLHQFTHCYWISTIGRLNVSAHNLAMRRGQNDIDVKPATIKWQHENEILAVLVSLRYSATYFAQISPWNTTNYTTASYYSSNLYFQPEIEDSCLFVRNLACRGNASHSYFSRTHFLAWENGFVHSTTQT